MELISKWSAIVAGCEQAAAELGYEGDTWDSDARAVAVSEARAQAFAECMRDIESACAPRPPKPEWFGEAPGKWDCWMIRLTSNWFLIRGAKTIKQGRQIYDEMSDDFFSMDSIAECVPVTREGFPAPVGWSVVGG